MFTHFKPITLVVSLLTTLTAASCIPINPSDTVRPSTTPTPSGTARPSPVPTSSSTVPYGVMIQQCTQPGVIALTFDDGPYIYTPTLLDILSEYNAHATFFVNGEGPNFEYPDYSAVINRIVDEGHQIGSHTYVSLTIFLPSFLLLPQYHHHHYKHNNKKD